MTRQEYLVKYRQDNKEKIAAKAKIYGKTYREKHRDKLAKYNETFRSENKAQASITNEIWRKNNKDKDKKRQQIWSRDNRGLRNAANAIVRAKSLNRLPAWSDLELCKQVYLDCTEINIIAKMVGCEEVYVVDHDLALQAELVSGLHVENNLIIITEQENMSKGNKFYVDQIPF